MKKTHIVFLINSLPEVGPVKVLKGIVDYLDRSHFDVTIIKLLKNKNEEDNKLLEQNCNIIQLKYSKIKLELQTTTIGKVIDQLLTQLTPDIIHTHGYHPTLIASKIKYNCIKIETLHNICGQDYISSKGLLVGNWMKKRYFQALNSIDGGIAISKTVQDYYYQNTNLRHIDLIYNGINTDNPQASKETIRKNLSLPLGMPIFVCVGNLSKIKDPITVIKAYKILKEKSDLNPILLFLGKGKLLKKCKKEAKGTPGIFFVGWKPNPLEYIKASDYMICASRSEGFGLNLFESLSVNTPVIASDNPTFLEFGKKFQDLTPYMFSTGNPVSLSESMKKIMYDKPDFKDSVTMVREEFSYKRMSTQYANLYIEYINKSK